MEVDRRLIAIHRIRLTALSLLGQIVVKRDCFDSQFHCFCGGEFHGSSFRKEVVLLIEDIPSFFSVGGWILAGLILLGNGVGTINKAWHALHEPVREVRSMAQEGDRSLQDQLDEARKEHQLYEEYFRNDSNDIKIIKQELLRQGSVDAEVIEGLYLIIQHLTTGNHTDEMKEWMRRFASHETQSQIME